VALGCAPGLGFVHVGHECSFVYDIADLYKAEVTIPIAFEVAAQAPEDLPAVVRRRVRDAMVEHHILERMVHDIRWLLLTEEEQLFPAHAGVIPRPAPPSSGRVSFPRTRGGDPCG
jgi:CRISPR-associated protein Cas1